MPLRDFDFAAKRLLDVLLASLLLMVLSPAALLVGVMIRLQMGRPVFFRQTRIGFHNHPFRIWKFRTMAERRDQTGALLPDAERLTRLGRFVRASSLDELPQLWNVLLGEMSLIGPRPLLPEYLPRYSPVQRRRHEAKPGITGWAQVNGRNNLTWERRFALDVWYVEHCSLALDLKILWMTLAHVLRPRGISQGDHATMPEFLGTPDQAHNT